MANITAEYRLLSTIQSDTFSDINYLNSNKNRYTNILTLDETRIKLKNLKNDYINANYITNFNKDIKFISTQAPLINTFRDFWKMAWDQNSTFILLLSNFKENNKIKVDKYWSDLIRFKYDSTETSDNTEIEIIVKLINEDVLELGTLRSFELTYNNISRKIYHFQYIGWKDHRGPSDPKHINILIDYIFKYSNQQIPIIHCSAGIGRTGTFIACTFLKSKPKIDIFSLVKHLRTCRVGMVQTEEQYKFLYEYLNY